MHKAAGQVVQGGQVAPGKRRRQRSAKNINAQKAAYMDAMSMAAAEFATRDRSEGYMELAHNVRQLNQDAKTPIARFVSSFDEMPLVGDGLAIIDTYGRAKNGWELGEKGWAALSWIGQGAGGALGGLFGGGAG